MWSTFTFHENRQGVFFLFRFFFFFSFAFIKNNPPTRLKDLFARDFKFHFFHFAQYGGGRYFTIGIEISNKPAGYQVVNPFFVIRQSGRLNTGRDDGMVIGNLAIIKYFLRFWDFITQDILR